MIQSKKHLLQYLVEPFGKQRINRIRRQQREIITITRIITMIKTIISITSKPTMIRTILIPIPTLNTITPVGNNSKLLCLPSDYLFTFIIGTIKTKVITTLNSMTRTSTIPLMTNPIQAHNTLHLKTEQPKLRPSLWQINTEMRTQSHSSTNHSIHKFISYHSHIEAQLSNLLCRDLLMGSHLFSLSSR